MEYDDYAVVQQCLNGNTELFERIIDKYQKPIFNLAYRMLHNFDDAEDITQNVFIKTYENLSSFNPKFKFFSWVYRIAINESINTLNKKNKNEEIVTDINSKQESVDKLIDTIDLNEMVENALKMLEINYRTVIVLKHFMDFSYKEISHILNIPEKTVKSRLFSARQLLKDILTPKGT